MSLLTISSDLGFHFDHSGLPLSEVGVEIERCLSLFLQNEQLNDLASSHK
jgi:hypothetical protein